MSTVFKYCDARGVEILTNLELKVTPPNQFNDPFEFMANIACSNPILWANQNFNEDWIRELHTSMVLEGRVIETLHAFRKRFKANRARFIKDWMNQVWPKAIENTQANVLDDISECLGVLCMSGKETSILMWGHYCDSHRGIVIGFDDSSEVFRRELGLRRVNYEEKRVEFDLAAVRSPEENQALNERIILSKNKEWSYEEEVRQLFHLRDLRKGKLWNGKDGYFCAIPPEAIACVYLGTKALDETKAKVRKALESPLLSHVRLQQASLHKTEFRIDFD